MDIRAMEHAAKRAQQRAAEIRERSREERKDDAATGISSDAPQPAPEVDCGQAADRQS